MKIGIIIGRIGGVDGVALETEKWIDVLKKRGHEIFILAGQYEHRKIEVTGKDLLPVLSFFSPECLLEQSRAFFHPEDDPKPLLEGIEVTSNMIAKEIVWWLIGNNIEVLISENASALPSHLSMGLGIKKAVEHTGIPIITHDHDFAWERGMRYVSPHDIVNQFTADLFPLRLPNVRHAVINTEATKSLKKRYKREATIVPNVMDFNKTYATLTQRASQLPSDLGLAKDDVILSQVTRIVRRKGIEVAIKLVDKLNDPRIKLLITGNVNDDNDGYSDSLYKRVKRYKLEKQVIWASKFISQNFNEEDKTKKRYSLSEIYANSTACTYFSTYEGFGNAFLESIVAKKPIFVNNYKPVYWPDIGSKGFKTVQLEANKLTDETVAEMKEIIFNPKLQKEIGEFNFELGRKHFSYEVLDERLSQLLNFTY